MPSTPSTPFSLSFNQSPSRPLYHTNPNAPHSTDLNSFALKVIVGSHGATLASAAGTATFAPGTLNTATGDNLGIMVLTAAQFAALIPYDHDSCPAPAAPVGTFNLFGVSGAYGTAPVSPGSSATPIGLLAGTYYLVVCYFEANPGAGHYTILPGFTCNVNIVGFTGP